MCDICKKNYGPIDITITDASDSRTYCPNCLAFLSYNGKLELTNDPSFVCDVRGGSTGAVKFESDCEEYILGADIMMRLIKHNLTPDEYFMLANKYGANKYMIHDDFYDPISGEALQPIDEDPDDFD